MQRQSFTYKRNWYSHYGLWLIKPPFTSPCFENLHQENVLLSKLRGKDLVPVKMIAWRPACLQVGYRLFSASNLISCKIQAHHPVKGRLESYSHVPRLNKLEFTHTDTQMHVRTHTHRHTHTYSHQVLPILVSATTSWKTSKLRPRNSIIEKRLTFQASGEFTTFIEPYIMNHQYSFFHRHLSSQSCLFQETWSREDIKSIIL